MPTVIGSYSTEDIVCVVVGYHQRGGGGGSLPVELSFRLRLSRATSKGMMSTQPMAPKSAKSRLSSSSEDELSSRISVDSSSSCTNRLRSARSLSSACRSASDIFGSFNLVELDEQRVTTELRVLISNYKSITEQPYEACFTFSQISHFIFLNSICVFSYSPFKFVISEASTCQVRS